MAEWKFIGARRYECSNCGEAVIEMPCDWANREPLYDYCPYCGANMRAEQTEPSTDGYACLKKVGAKVKQTEPSTDCSWK